MRSSDRAGRERNGFTDLARFLGAIGIAWFHARGPGGWIGHAALPMFLALTIYFSLDQADGRPLAAALGQRARRLLRPWLVWSMIYAGLKLAQAAMTGAPVSAEFEPWMLLTGPSLHLWFFPFSFAATALLLVFLRGAEARAGFAASIGALAAAALAALAADRLGAPLPINLWLNALPATLFGAALWFARGDARRTALAAAAMAGLAVLIGAGGAADLARNLALGLAITTLAIGVSLRSSVLTRRLGAASLGLYLIHPMVIALALAAGVPTDAPAAFAALVVGIASIGAIAAPSVPGARRFF